MNELDKHFKDHLEGLEIAPSPNLWKQKIAGNLASAPAKSFAIWYRAAAVIILFLGSWFAVSYFGNGQKIQQPQMPVANQPAEVVPTHQQENAEIQPVSIEEENTEKTVAVVKKSTPKPNHKSVVKEEAPVQVAQDLKTSAMPVVAESKVKVKISIASQDKYLTPEVVTVATNTTAAPATQPGNVKDYALAQFKNLAKREKLEAPPKEWFELPQLALRVEGNPLKKVLLPN